jgi:DNA-binding beta-propeller fold protein YncE
LGRYVYVANGTSNDVSQYAIGADGSLAPLAFATVAAGTNPSAVTVDLSGAFVYVADRTSAGVTQYAVGLNGALTPLSPSTVVAGSSPRSVAAVGRYQ